MVFRNYFREKSGVDRSIQEFLRQHCLCALKFLKKSAIEVIAFGQCRCIRGIADPRVSAFSKNSGKIGEIYLSSMSIETLVSLRPIFIRRFVF